VTLLEKPFQDVELVLLDLIDPVFPVVVTATNETIAGETVQIERVGGSDNGITDSPRVRITCYAETRPKAWRLARNVQAFLINKATTQIITGPETAEEYPRGVQLDSVSTATPPRQLAEGGRNARIVETIYQFGLRRPWW
jgi:hypothetical protein